jgi:mannosyl-oligosaccharide alpha-1,2-mannosidase
VQHPVDSYSQLPTGTPSPLPRVQHAFTKPSAKAVEKNISRRKAVRQVFARCWNGYRNHAWMEDELAPVSGRSKKTFGGWGATLVDSLDTLWLMDMRQEFVEAVDAVMYIDFGPNSPGEVNMFETAIRYLGGFIAGYDISGCQNTRLLQKAIEVGDMIYASFDTPNRLPVGRWNPQRAVDGHKQYPA